MILNKQNQLTYRKITEKSTLKSLTSDRWEEKVELSDKLMNNIQNLPEYITYAIGSHQKTAGFITINEKFLKRGIIKVEALYIYKKYRHNYIATEILKDIDMHIRKREDITHIRINSYITSTLFFNKNGYEFFNFENKYSTDEECILSMQKIKRYWT